MTAAKRKERLHHDLLQLLEGVTEESLELSYDGIATVLQKYKGQLSITEVLDVLTLINRQNLSPYQEEIIWDVANRLRGQCPPHRKIPW
jgi:hypothetical protein